MKWMSFSEKWSLLRRACLRLSVASVTSTLLILLSTALALDWKNPAQTSAVDENRAKVRAQIDITKIQWPLPPAVPRIQMLSELTGEAPPPPELPPPPPKRLNWKDHLAGIKNPPEERRVVRETKRLMSPYGVVADSSGRIYAADAAARAILIFDRDGSVAWYREGGAVRKREGLQFRFQNIIGLAIDDRDRLFVTDSELRQVTVINRAGELEAVFGSQHLVRPAGAAIDNGYRLLYVADTGQDRVAVFDADSFAFIHYIGDKRHAGSVHDAGLLNKPSNVAVGPYGRVYVTDTFNSRIQVFDVGGGFVGTLGSMGFGPGRLLRPKGIAIDCDGHIWVADAGQYRVQVFDGRGHLLAYFGQRGGLPAQFMLPAGLFIDQRNRVIVSDQGTGRVQVFRYITEDEASFMKARRKEISAGTIMVKAH